MSLSRVAYVELAVADIERSLAHATEVLGLRVADRVGRSVYLTCSERHHELVLTESDTDRLGGIALEVQSSEDLEAVRGRLAEAGFVCEDVQVPGVAEAKTFLAPGGIRFELIRGMELSEPRLFNSIGCTPRKFGHATLLSDAFEELESVLCGPLGFRLSDQIVPNVMYWYRCSADHHGVAVVPSTSSGLHHYAFEVEGWASLEAFSDHLATNDVRLIWGPGRHGPGRNLFTYHLDPTGTVVEVFCDLHRIDNDEVYEPGSWPMTPETFNQWGPPAPSDFLDHLLPPKSTQTNPIALQPHPR